MIHLQVIYGRIPDENESTQEDITLGRRTRGRKISYLDAMPSDSDEASFIKVKVNRNKIVYENLSFLFQYFQELKKALRKTEETEEEFVVGPHEDFNDDAEKDSDSGELITLFFRRNLFFRFK